MNTWHFCGHAWVGTGQQKSEFKQGYVLPSYFSSHTVESMDYVVPHLWHFILYVGDFAFENGPQVA